jgi:CheY-like chemotaxis protein
VHLPRKSGHEVLAEIKEDASLRLIPVVILTAQDSEQSFQHAYDLHANCCVRKPADLEQFALTVKKIETFWLCVASMHRGRLPSIDAGALNTPAPEKNSRGGLIECS